MSQFNRGLAVPRPLQSWHSILSYLARPRSAEFNRLCYIVAFDCPCATRMFSWPVRLNDLFDDFSPDFSKPLLAPETKVATYTQAVGGELDVWLIDSEWGVASSLTTSSERERAPVWSPDGRQVALCGQSLPVIPPG
jgi:WD40 repeat protein